ncbi:MAG: hypothetical protein JXR77_02935 [Lentisphaeria bacterium]|nr:hypothetical protein [Lentisphaeria bacterium]
METIKCPYCECKVLMSDVEDEDGTCPECGAPLLASLMMQDLAGDDNDDDIDMDRPDGDDFDDGSDDLLDMDEDDDLDSDE